MARAGVAGAAAIVMLAACAGGRGAASPQSAGRAPVPASGRLDAAGGADSARRMATRTQLLYALAGHSFTVQSIGSVVLVGDTSARVDTVRATTVVRFDRGEIGAGRLGGRVVTRVRGAAHEVRGDARADADRVDSGAFVYVVDSVAQDSSPSGGRIVIVPTTACPDTGGTAYHAVSDALLPAPRSLVAGAAWVDTVTTATCRGTILLTTVAVRRFTVAGAAGGSVATVSHSTTAALHGSTASGGAAVVVTGEGTGQRVARYDLASGTLLGSESDLELDLTVRVAGRATQLHQSAHTRVVADSAGAAD